MSVSVDRPARHLEVVAEQRLLWYACQRRGDFLLLLRRRRADVQHVDLHLRLLGRGCLGRRLLCRQGQGEKGGPKDISKDGKDDSRHAGILTDAGGILNSKTTADPALNVVKSGMANLTLVYGMRLLPSEDIAQVGEAP